MPIRDEEYLYLQFKVMMMDSITIKFQSFFESLMGLHDPDFEPVRPIGSLGDMGNDGYIPTEGLYFQCYSPLDPQNNESEAAKKWQKDFEKLLNSQWNVISPIKKHIFVFNNYNRALGIPLRQAKSELERNNSNIEFEIWGVEKLFEICYGLNDSQLAKLNFKLDKQSKIELIQNQCGKIKREIQKCKIGSSREYLNLLSSSLNSIDEPEIQKELKLLEAKILLLNEEQENFFKVLKNILSSSNDGQTIYLLANYLLINKDTANAEEHICKVSSNDEWHQVNQNLLKVYLNSPLNDTNLRDLNTEIKIELMKLSAIHEMQNNHFDVAEKYIIDAFNFAQDNMQLLLMLYRCKIEKLVQGKENYKIDEILSDLHYLEHKIQQIQPEAPRIKLSFNLLKIERFIYFKMFDEAYECIDESLSLITGCYFDSEADDLLIHLLLRKIFNKEQITKITHYLKGSASRISRKCGILLVNQLHAVDLLVSLTNDFKAQFEKDAQEIIEYFNQADFSFFHEENFNDIEILLAFTKNKRIPHGIKEGIYNRLTKMNFSNLAGLRFFLDLQSGNYQGASDYIEKKYTFDIDENELFHLLEVAYQIGDWRGVLYISERLINKKVNQKKGSHVILHLYNAAIHLKINSKIIETASQIINHQEIINQLSPENKEKILVSLVKSLSENSQLQDAFVVILENEGLIISAWFLLDIAMGLAIQLSQSEKAIDYLKRGFKLVPKINPEFYARLFLYLTQLENIGGLNQESLTNITEESFVKFYEREDWYYIGDDPVLELNIIKKDEQLYSELLNKSINDIIEIKHKFSSSNTSLKIEKIFSLEKYIYFQSIKAFNDIAFRPDNSLGITVIEAKHNSDPLEFMDTEYIKRALEKMENPRNQLFYEYCNSRLPISLLARTEGSIKKALSRISSEDQGFVHFSTGVGTDLLSQFNVAQSIVKNKKECVIDGTALILFTENEILDIIFGSYSVKIPYSTINLLRDILSIYESPKGAEGYLCMRKGEIQYIPKDKESIEKFISTYKQAIEFLENQNEKHIYINEIEKKQCFSETELPEGLTDALIYSKKRNISIITDDIYYLQMNSIETGDQIPAYASSYFMVNNLYLNGIITLDKFLNIINYMTYFRYKFIPVSSEFLCKVISSDDPLFNFDPIRVKKLGLNFILSQAYGVNKVQVIVVIGEALYNFVRDDTIPLELFNSILTVIVEELPTDFSKYFWVIGIHTFIARKSQLDYKTFYPGKLYNEKISRIKDLIQIYYGSFAGLDY